MKIAIEESVENTVVRRRFLHEQDRYSKKRSKRRRRRPSPISWRKVARSMAPTARRPIQTWITGPRHGKSPRTHRPGHRRKRVAPEIIRSRQEAHDRMVKLIIDARAAKKTATYKVKAKTLLADRVVEPFWIDNLHTAQPTIIDWDGIPNEAMAPENKTAKAIYEAYQGWIGSTVRVHPEDELAITPGGLVVHGGAAGISGGRRRLPGGAEAPQSGSPTEGGGLNVHHKNEPGRYVEKRILGSIAPPARQTV